MRKEKIEIPLQILALGELSDQDSTLVEEALKIAEDAYAPYSEFRVGAAVRLRSGTIVTGSNQENAAYPSGLCAERTTLFYAGAQYPDDPVESLTVVAIKKDGTQAKVAAPCGGCRQVLLETADRHKHPFRVLLAGPEEVIVVEDCRDLLPIGFEASSM